MLIFVTFTFGFHPSFWRKLFLLKMRLLAQNYLSIEIVFGLFDRGNYLIIQSKFFRQTHKCSLRYVNLCQCCVISSKLMCFCFQSQNNTYTVVQNTGLGQIAIGDSRGHNTSSIQSALIY